MTKADTKNGAPATGATPLTFPAMAATYCLGAFNDNYFKQAALLLAIAAGLPQLQGWGAVLFALPFVLFSAHGGWCADRFVKRQVIVASKILELAAMLCGAAGLICGLWPLIMTMIFLMGLQSAFFGPSLNGAIPEIYPQQRVAHVNAVLKLASTLAILAGIAAAGFSLDVGERLFSSSFGGRGMVAIGAVSVSCLGVIASLFIRPFMPFTAGEHRRARSDSRFRKIPWLGPFNSLRDLFSICRNKQLCLAVLGDTWFYFIASIAVLVLNLLGGELGFSKSATSMLSVALMVGVCAGSFLAAKLMRLERWSAFLVHACFGMAIGLVCIAAVAHLEGVLLTAGLFLSLFFTGVCGGLFLIPVATALQVFPAADEKGRVLGAASFSSFTAILISGLLFNLFTFFLSASGMFLFLGSLGFAASLGFALCRRCTVSPLTAVAGFALRCLLSLRYRILVDGLADIAPIAGRGTLFVANHPALIDPLIVMSSLMGKFQPSPLSDAQQLSHPLIRLGTKIVRPVTIPDMACGRRGNRTRVEAGIAEIASRLQNGENVLLYPAGRIQRNGYDRLGANSAVERILAVVPDVRIVAVTTRGLWGSSFSWGAGESPAFLPNLKRCAKYIFVNAVFFTPRRRVVLSFCEMDLRRFPGRMAINRALEQKFNEEPSPLPMRVPYYWWQSNRDAMSGCAAR